MSSSDRPTPVESKEAPTKRPAGPSSFAPGSVPLSSRVRDKLPELILEAVSVVFAVLLALGVDQWRESSLERRAATRAKEAVEHELRSNADEVEQMIERNRSAVAELRRALESAEPGEELSFNFQLAELSSAAWQSAQLSGAVASLELDWLIGVSRLYEVQRLYTDGQRLLVDRLAGMGEAMGGSEPKAVLRGLLGRAESLLELSRSLLQRYRELLAGARIVEPEPEPEPEAAP